MQVLVTIDDTDRLGGRGTGHLAAILSDEIENRGWGQCQRISRHQLLVNDRIPYTSHNSAMSFAADIGEQVLEHLIAYASDFLERESAEGSDPGLCVAVPELLPEPGRLISFGQRAKRAVLTKEEAYLLSEEEMIHLSEHGGTGQGIIGALAGTGLRLSGNDGRFRGKLTLGPGNGVLSVAEIRARIPADQVRSLAGVVLTEDELVRVGDQVKTVLLDGMSVLPVFATDQEEIRWQTCTKEQWHHF